MVFIFLCQRTDIIPCNILLTVEHNKIGKSDKIMEIQKTPYSVFIGYG